MAVGVAVMMSVIVGMNVSHEQMLYYNITGVHALALSQVGLLAAPIARALLRLHPQGGRREDRVRAAPAVSRARWTQENAHEHTGSAEAIRPSLRGGLHRVHRIPPRVRDDREPPLYRVGWCIGELICVRTKEEYFRVGYWTNRWRDLPDGQHRP
jgi:hypothetical protein